MTHADKKPADGWNIPVRLDDVPEEGLHVAAAADPATCAVLARLVGVEAVLRLEATFDVVRHGSAGLTVMGNVSARVRQSCVLTLEPVENEINEPVAVTFVAPDAEPAIAAGETVVPVEGDDAPEPLVNGTTDLGRLATEFLSLAIDRYPRKAGAEFAAPAMPDSGGSPFDALAVLKKDGNHGT